MDYPIDFVIPWVDGNDEAWLKQRLQYFSDYTVNQYRDWDILKYWFRGIEQFAPWVNKIYFVTWGHVPTFLNVNHLKIVIVNHKDFIPSEYLPTFSSNVIETNIHRIKGLSEHFVYFNDDVFITKPLIRQDFFKDGMPCDSLIIKPIQPARYLSVSSTMLNNAGVVNENFNKRVCMKKNLSKWINPKYGFLNLLNIMFIPWPMFIGFYEQHMANAYLKSTFNEVWEKEYAVLNNTGLSQLRNLQSDVNQWLFKNWRLAKGEFVPRSIKFGKFVRVDSLDKAKEVFNIIEKQKFKMVCVNDHYEKEDLDVIIDVIQSGFESILSEKSEFEI